MFSLSGVAREGYVTLSRKLSRVRRGCRTHNPVWLAAANGSESELRGGPVPCSVLVLDKECRCAEPSRSRSIEHAQLPWPLVDLPAGASLFGIAAGKAISCPPLQPIPFASRSLATSGCPVASVRFFVCRRSHCCRDKPSPRMPDDDSRETVLLDSCPFRLCQNAGGRGRLDPRYRARQPDVLLIWFQPHGDFFIQFLDHLFDVAHVPQRLTDHEAVMIGHSMSLHRFDDLRNLWCQAPVSKLGDFGSALFVFQ